MLYAALVVSDKADLKNVLPWKVENVVIPVQSLSSGRLAVLLKGVGPLGAVIKLILLPTML